MEIICILKVVLLFLVKGMYTFRSVGYTLILQGYIPQNNVVCPGNDFMGGHTASDFNDCKKLCDEQFLCVAFQYSQRHSGVNCWPKALCDTIEQHHGGWVLYTKSSGKGGCTFDAMPGYALYGENDIILKDVTLNGCKNKCLRDNRCLSFDYNNTTKLCFISYESKETSESFGRHQMLTYYQKRCGPGLDSVSKDILHSAQGSVVSLKDGHCIRTFGPYGGFSGTDFTFEENVLLNITAVQVRFGTYINSLGLKYGSQPLVKYGGYGYRTVTTDLSEDEYIVTVEGRCGTLIDQLTFITNKRTLGPYGSTGGMPFIADGRGQPLLFISGSTGGSLVNVALHFKC